MAKFRIENTEVHGLERSLVASGNSFSTRIKSVSEISDKDFSRGYKLANTPNGAGHDQFLTGIVVWLDLYAPLYQWKQIQRYKFFDYISLI